MFQSAIQTTGTFNFFPSTAELTLLAFSRIQMRSTELEALHFFTAQAEFNLMLVTFNDLGPNLAQVDQISVALTSAVPTYAIPTETVMLLDVFIRYGSPSVDRYLTPISRTEYAALPVKTTPGIPSQFWFDRLISPTITFYFVPDGNGPYTMFAYRMRQIQDAQMAGGTNPEVPNRALDALTAGLAHRLARHFKPELEAIREKDAEKAWMIYAKQDTENVSLNLAPMLSGYYRV